jgi:electron transfer flavoprotein beta subunit
MIVVLLKWVGLRPEVDPLTATVSTDDRFTGASLADRAALELALLIGSERNLPVHVITVAPKEADSMLRDALAAGATQATRIDPQVTDWRQQQPVSRSVATAIAEHVVRIGSDSLQLVLSGDWSVDRGSGSVPPLVAHHLGLEGVCGAVRVHMDVDSLVVERRLDGGRREVLSVTGPAVISVEGGVATLRRAPLAGVLSSKSARIEVVSQALPVQQPGVRVERVVPHRPPAPVLNINASSDPRERLSALLGVGVERTPPMRVTLDADAAADLIIDRLIAWSQLPA